MLEISQIIIDSLNSNIENDDEKYTIKKDALCDVSDASLSCYCKNMGYILVEITRGNIFAKPRQSMEARKQQTKLIIDKFIEHVH